MDGWEVSVWRFQMENNHLSSVHSETTVSSLDLLLWASSKDRRWRKLSLKQLTMQLWALRSTKQRRSRFVRGQASMETWGRKKYQKVRCWSVFMEDKTQTTTTSRTSDSSLFLTRGSRFRELINYGKMKPINLCVRKKNDSVLTFSLLRRKTPGISYRPTFTHWGK